MGKNSLTVLFLGDVVGRSGMRAVIGKLRGLITRYDADVVIVNGENADEGGGLNPSQMRQIFDSGAQVITTGNHVWHDAALREYLDQEPRLLRPANYPPRNPGHGECMIEQKGQRVAVFNLQGRSRLTSIDCPFRRVKEMLRTLPASVAGVVIDFHAEDPAEKEAFAHHVNGAVSVVVGTHTHVQTTDERIFSGGTGYITDAGACCSPNGVIGFDPTISLERARSQLPLRVMPQDDAAVICGLVVRIACDSGHATHLQRIQEHSAV